jgi:hypothetical protein
MGIVCVCSSLTRYTCMYEPGPLPSPARYQSNGTSGTWPGELSLPTVKVSDGRVGPHAGVMKWVDLCCILTRNHTVGTW